MKHLVIIALGLAGVMVFLNYDRIRNHLHLAAKSQDSTPALEVQPASAAVLQTNLPLLAPVAAAPTNSVSSNPATNWPSATATHYAELIKNIRAARGN
jgi:hypothetical protein